MFMKNRQDKDGKRTSSRLEIAADSDDGFTLRDEEIHSAHKI